MITYLHRLRERGWPIPKYQFAFKEPAEGELTLKEEMDLVFNRHTRVARFARGQEVYMLFDAQLIELTRERMILSGIERERDDLINKVEDFAQTWVCWFMKDEN